MQASQTPALTPMAAIVAFAAQHGLVPRANRQRRPGGSYAGWVGGLGYSTASNAQAAGAVVASMPVVISGHMRGAGPACMYVVRGVGGALYLCSGYTPTHGLGMWDFVPAAK